mgnify:CR=1 FL=1
MGNGQEGLPLAALEHADDEHDDDNKNGAEGEGISESPGINLREDLGGHDLRFRSGDENNWGKCCHRAGEGVCEASDECRSDKRHRHLHEGLEA